MTTVFVATEAVTSDVAEIGESISPSGDGFCAVTPHLKAPASLGPGNSWLVFEKELDDALDVSAKAGDEVGARLDENKIRIFGA